jgi:hypothetical protein
MERKTKHSDAFHVLVKSGGRPTTYSKNKSLEASPQQKKSLGVDTQNNATQNQQKLPTQPQPELQHRKIHRKKNTAPNPTEMQKTLEEMDEPFCSIPEEGLGFRV